MIRRSLREIRSLLYIFKISADRNVATSPSAANVFLRNPARSFDIPRGFAARPQYYKYAAVFFYKQTDDEFWKYVKDKVPTRQRAPGAKGAAIGSVGRWN
jgi:hypothetical protein